MPTVPAGNKFIALTDRVLWAPLETPFPGVNVPHGGFWGAAWTEIKDTVNGLAVTKRSPTVAINSEERGRIGSIKGEGGGVAVGLQAQTFTAAFWEMIGNQKRKVVSAQAQIESLVITAGATALGAVTVTLDGVATSITLTGTAPLSPDAVATQIRAATFTGWTTGGTGSTVTFTATATGAKGAAAFSGGTTGATGTFTTTRVGHSSYDIGTLSTDRKNQFMVGFEGIAVAGTLFDNDTLIRGVAHCVENTQDAQDVFRETGADALLRPNLTLEAVPYPYVASQFTNKGILLDDLDKEERFNYFYIPIA